MALWGGDVLPLSGRDVGRRRFLKPHAYEHCAPSSQTDLFFEAGMIRFVSAHVGAVSCTWFAAQRLGKVFVSPTTWYRFVRLDKWRRPRGRIHPSKPNIGIRASGPNQIWHVDTTLIRLLDGSRAYLQAVIDHFSRRILAWKVSATFDPSTTAPSRLWTGKMDIRRVEAAKHHSKSRFRSVLQPGSCGVL